MFDLLDRYEYLQPLDLAEWLGVTEAYIYKLRREGTLPFVVVDGVNHISTAVIRNWIESNLTC